MVEMGGGRERLIWILCPVDPAPGPLNPQIRQRFWMSSLGASPPVKFLARKKRRSSWALTRGPIHRWQVPHPKTNASTLATPSPGTDALIDTGSDGDAPTRVVLLFPLRASLSLLLLGQTDKKKSLQRKK